MCGVTIFVAHLLFVGCVVCLRSPPTTPAAAAAAPPKSPFQPHPALCDATFSSSDGNNTAALDSFVRSINVGPPKRVHGRAGNTARRVSVLGLHFAGVLEFLHGNQRKALQYLKDVRKDLGLLLAEHGDGNGWATWRRLAELHYGQIVSSLRPSRGTAILQRIVDQGDPRFALAPLALAAALARRGEFGGAARVLQAQLLRTPRDTGVLDMLGTVRSPFLVPGARCIVVWCGVVRCGVVWCGEVPLKSITTPVHHGCLCCCALWQVLDRAHTAVPARAALSVQPPGVVTWGASGVHPQVHVDDTMVIATWSDDDGLPTQATRVLLCTWVDDHAFSTCDTAQAPLELGNVAPGEHTLYSRLFHTTDATAASPLITTPFEVAVEGGYDARGGFMEGSVPASFGSAAPHSVWSPTIPAAKEPHGAPAQDPSSPSPSVAGAAPVSAAPVTPMCFVTIALNGMPFLPHHFAAFQALPTSIPWAWYVVEGVAIGRWVCHACKQDYARRLFLCVTPYVRVVVHH